MPAPSRKRPAKIPAPPLRTDCYVSRSQRQVREIRPRDSTPHPNPRDYCKKALCPEVVSPPLVPTRAALPECTTPLVGVDFRHNASSAAAREQDESAAAA